MSEKTAISWTTHTWNPWRGCAKVSTGCLNCYMFTEQRRYGKDPAVVTRTKTWGEPLKWQKKAAAAGKTEMVFTCSWSDFFIEEADDWREEAWQVIQKTPNLHYQILTKRPENIASRLPKDWGSGYPNVWLGVSVENQRYADERIPKLLEIPAVVRFLSCEPLLGPLQIAKHFDPQSEGQWLNTVECGHHPSEYGISWVIVGGESGAGFRPMDLAWARSLRDQCRAASVPFFFKQSSDQYTERGIELDGEIIREFPTPRIPASKPRLDTLFAN